MVTTGKSEAARWGWLSIAVTVLGVAIITMPWIPGKYKILLAIPVYVMLFYVYYKYLNLKRLAKTKTVSAQKPGENRAARRQADRLQKKKK